MKKILLVAIALLPIVALGQVSDDKGGTTTPPPSGPNEKQPSLVSITAKGTDVRAVIADLFGQAKVNYVLQPGIQFALFMSLDKVQFDEALNIICAQAKLQFDVQNGIYFISKAKPPVVAAAIPTGILDVQVLGHKLSTKLHKTDIKDVFSEFGKQTKVRIEVDSSVPHYKLDAILTDITLGSALDKVTAATGLKYKFTDSLSILIYKPAEPNNISVSGG